MRLQGDFSCMHPESVVEGNYVTRLSGTAHTETVAELNRAPHLSRTTQTQSEWRMGTMRLSSLALHTQRQ